VNVVSSNYKNYFVFTQRNLQFYSRIKAKIISRQLMYLQIAGFIQGFGVFKLYCGHLAFNLSKVAVTNVRQSVTVEQAQ